MSTQQCDYRLFLVLPDSGFIYDKSTSIIPIHPAVLRVGTELLTDFDVSGDIKNSPFVGDRAFGQRKVKNNISSFRVA